MDSDLIFYTVSVNYDCVGAVIFDISRSNRQSHPIRRTLLSFLRCCGFKNRNEYLDSLPGHSKDDETGTFTHDVIFVDLRNTPKKPTIQKFDLQFVPVEFDDVLNKDGLPDVGTVNLVLGGTIYKGEDVGMLLIQPELDIAKKLFYNDVSASSKDLWFCNGWGEA